MANYLYLILFHKILTLFHQSPDAKFHYIYNLPYQYVHTHFHTSNSTLLYLTALVLLYFHQAYQIFQDQFHKLNCPPNNFHKFYVKFSCCFDELQPLIQAILFHLASFQANLQQV